jgi:hypothetical protein
MNELEDETTRREREAHEQEDELRRVPLQTIDKSKWPTNVRPIAISETGGLGIDPNGRLYWNGKPVEIVSQRLDLTWIQTAIALSVAVFTFIAALATSVQAWTAYHDWACRVGWPVATKCPPPPPVPPGIIERLLGK